MPDKPPKGDCRKIWKWVLASIPNGLWIRKVSVKNAEEERGAEPSEPMDAPPETPTPGPVGSG